jgi:hypothetical protein
MTKTEQIIRAVEVALAAAGLNVRTDTASQESFEDLPVVVVVAGADIPRADTVGGAMVYWDLAVSLIIAADGPAPTLAPEATRAAVHAALYADRTLGGLAVDLTAGAVNRSIDEENPALGIAEATYNIFYRQLEGQV